MSQFSAVNPHNPYTFPSNDQNNAVVSPMPSRIEMSAEPPKRTRDTQVTIDEQHSQISALKHMVADYERQLSEARATNTARRSQIQGNHVDATKEVLQNYESTINNLKADNMKYKHLETRVKELERDKKILEDEVDKARRVKITLENQIEKWQGMEGNLPELRVRCSKLESDNVRYQEELKRLRGESYSLKKKVEETEDKYREIKKYEQEASNYVLRIRDLEQEIDFLKEEKKAIRANENVRHSTLQNEVEKLRDQNRELDSKLSVMTREVQQAKDMAANNTNIVLKMRLIENENEGLKSMLAMNQKIPKNMIFNDDVKPGGAANQVDSSKLVAVECQLAITKAELIRLFEENLDLKKRFDQQVSDISILKKKLYKKVGSPSGSYFPDTSIPVSPKAQAIAGSMKPVSKPMFSSAMGSFDDNPPQASGNSALPKYSISNSKPQPSKQVTFDIDRGDQRKMEDSADALINESLQNHIARSVVMVQDRQNEAAQNRLAHSQSVTANKVRLPPSESVDIQDLDLEDDLPRFGLSTNVPLNASQFPHSRTSK